MQESLDLLPAIP
jgi:hypothetical protein